MKVNFFINFYKFGITFCLILFLSLTSFSQSCHSGDKSSTGSQYRGNNKGVVNSSQYKKSTKKKYYICKKHPGIKYDTMGICSICSKKLKKRYEYSF